MSGPARRALRNCLNAPRLVSTMDDVTDPLHVLDARLSVHLHHQITPRYPPILKLASAAILTMSLSLAFSETICTGFSSPTMSGPITVAPPSSCSMRVEIEAEWNAGMMSTLAVSVSRQNG